VSISACLALLYLPQNLPDPLRVLNTGNDVHGCTNAAGARTRKSGHPQLPAAFETRLEIDGEHPFEELPPLVRKSQ
jgi:hypothetical protein